MRRPSFFLFVDNYSCNKQVKLDGTSCQTHGRLILVGPNNSLKLTIPYIKNDSSTSTGRIVHTNEVKVTKPTCQ